MQMNDDGAALGESAEGLGPPPPFQLRDISQLALRATTLGQHLILEGEKLRHRQLQVSELVENLCICSFTYSADICYVLTVSLGPESIARSTAIRKAWFLA